MFQENFSIGMRYRIPDTGHWVTLLRCNGIHGKHYNQRGEEWLHMCCHIHRMQYDRWIRGEKEESYANETKSYVTLEQALLHFLRLTNVCQKDIIKYLERYGAVRLPGFDGDSINDHGRDS